jgi:ubiquinone/menaquinone biosynthesis C-methylase UbiE
MAVSFTSRELSKKYDQFARWFDWVESVLDLLGVSTLRRQLMKRASGRVLEVSVGTGKNLHYYPGGCQIVAVDLSREMLALAQTRATRLGASVPFLLADAEALPFSARNFDTVVSSLSTCTFSNPVTALEEMARVCRTDGKIVLLEHGRSNREWLGRWQDKRADRIAKQLACHWNRETLELVRQAGLKIHNSRRVFFGVFHQIEAAPGPV